jgi:hypothetical protein
MDLMDSTIGIGRLSIVMIATGPVQVTSLIVTAIGVHLYAYVPIWRPVDKVECSFVYKRSFPTTPSRLYRGSLGKFSRTLSRLANIPACSPLPSLSSARPRHFVGVDDADAVCNTLSLDTPPVDSMHSAVNMQVAVRLMCWLSCRTGTAPMCGVFRIRATWITRTETRMTRSSDVPAC